MITLENLEETFRKEYRKNPVLSFKKRKQKKEFIWREYTLSWYLIVLAVLVVLLFLIIKVTSYRKNMVHKNMLSKIEADMPNIDVQLLTINKYSRPGTALKQVNGIVIHYTGNIGTSAKANRDYFESLKDSHATKASSHFIVGLDGEIVQCIPTEEVSYASNSRNYDTLSIECCYEKGNGSFNQATYDEAIYLTAWLCAKFNLTGEDVIRHYDITGKMCPLYYVEHEEAWEQFRKDVDICLKECWEKYKRS